MSIAPPSPGAIPEAIEISDADTPWVDTGEGYELKVIMVSITEGYWIVRNRFAPGSRVQTHKHTGPVYAYTLSGSWKYEEYDLVNRAGSFLFEPANSQHTLVVPEDNDEITDVWFHIFGANLNLDAEGRVESVYDGPFVLAGYEMLCEASGLGKPNVLVT